MAPGRVEGVLCATRLVTRLGLVQRDRSPCENQHNVSAVQTGSAPKLSVYQLERMLAESRLQEER